MPYSGYDPYGGWDSGAPIDNSGGGLDPSYAWSLAAGGGFPGADQNSLEYNAAASTGRNLGNPDYQAPGWLSWLANHAGARGSLARTVLGRLVSGHEANVRSPGGGQDPEGLGGGYPYHFFSGPGASYGPADGPGTGLVDFGRGVASEWDLPESKPPGQSTQGAPAGGKGGGGRGGHLINFTPYQGIAGGRGFVDWQPITPGTPGPYEPTRFVGGSPAPAPAKIPAPAGRPGQVGKVGKVGKVGTGRGGGGGRGAGRPGAVTPPPASAGPGYQPGDQRPFGTNPLSPGVGTAARENTRGGVNVNNLDRGTPSWLSDPTAGTTNTSGFPNPTLPAPRSGESFDEYLTRLHDTGFGTDDIVSALGRNGFSPSGEDWDWGWGTGPVVRGDNGYTFANNSGSGYQAVDAHGNRIDIDFGGGRGGGGAGAGSGGYGGGSGGGSPTFNGSSPDTLASLMIPLY